MYAHHVVHDMRRGQEVEGLAKLVVISPQVTLDTGRYFANIIYGLQSRLWLERKFK